MSNPANQLPSYESDTIVQANSNICLLMDCNPMEIKYNQVVVKKENRGDESSKEFTLNYTAAIATLKPAFFPAKNFVQRSKDGEDVDAGNTNYSYTQEFFCINLTKVDSFEYHVVSSDLKVFFMIGELCKTLHVIK